MYCKNAILVINNIILHRFLAPKQPVYHIREAFTVLPACNPILAVGLACSRPGTKMQVKDFRMVTAALAASMTGSAGELL